LAYNATLDIHSGQQQSQPRPRQLPRGSSAAAAAAPCAWSQANQGSRPTAAPPRLQPIAACRCNSPLRELSGCNPGAAASQNNYSLTQKKQQPRGCSLATEPPPNNRAIAAPPCQLPHVSSPVKTGPHSLGKCKSPRLLTATPRCFAARVALEPVQHWGLHSPHSPLPKPTETSHI